MIVTLVLAGILALGTFKAIEAIYLRSARAKAVTELSMRSQILLDQLSVMMYRRVPGSEIGYRPSDSKCEALADMSDTLPVLEWIGSADEAAIGREYDGFVDLNNSTCTLLQTPHIDSELNVSQMNLIFSGALESGDESGAKVCEGAYGWHGHDSNKSFDIRIDHNDTITITDSVEPEFLYEKYYLAQSGYAVARLADIDSQATCIDENLTSHEQDDNDTLLLFYDYHPWSGETFCADGGSGATRAGSVTALAGGVVSFEAYISNDAIHISVDINQTIPGHDDVEISKRKVVF